MAPKWIAERIVSTEEVPLSQEDILKLKTKIKKQLKLFVPPYLLLLFISAFFIIYGPDSLYVGHRYMTDITDEQKKNFWIVAPYVSAFIALMATIFFGRYYFQNVQPLIRDLKSNQKKLLFFKPQKTEMSFFKRYYLGTPIFSNQQIQVSAEDFYTIDEKHLLCLEVAETSQEILRLMYMNKEINYW